MKEVMLSPEDEQTFRALTLDKEAAMKEADRLQIASQNLGATGQNVSLAVAVGCGVKADKTIAIVGESRTLTLPVAAGQGMENGGSGGARTRNLCRDRAAL